jgi:predicted Zn-dependent protease with MMP-like domain
LAAQHWPVVPAALVVQALEELPALFKDRLQNIELLIADWPTEEELEEAGMGPDELLLGLYKAFRLPSAPVTTA